jgi:hypothetical protein
MFAYFSRQRVVGALIVILACTLCIMPIFSRGSTSSALSSKSTDAVTHVAHYPPSPPEPVAPLTPPAPGIDEGYGNPIYHGPLPSGIASPAPPGPTISKPDHILEVKAFALMSTKYRLSSGKAKALAQFLEEQVGRPEVFEISVEDAETITIVASPVAQKTVAELVGLMRASPGKSKDAHPTASVPRG